MVRDINLYSMDPLESRLVTLHDFCSVAPSHTYNTSRIIDALVEGRFLSTRRMNNALHSLHWLLYNLREKFIKTQAVESGNDSIFACMFPSLQARTRDLLPLMIRMTEQESQEDLDALLQGRPLDGRPVLV